jgi:hypothetical protein
LSMKVGRRLGQNHNGNGHLSRSAS